MRLVLIKETVNDYKKTALLFAVRSCDYKCCNELNLDHSVCQNKNLDSYHEVDIKPGILVDKIIKNKIIDAIIFGGKEPMLDIYFKDMVEVIKELRLRSKIDIVIYTGYREDEIKDKIDILKRFENIILKVGRFVPNKPFVYDELLGVELANEGQYGIKIS